MKNVDVNQPITIYACGPTVYDHIHLGNGRMLVVFDVLNRLCKHYGQTTFVRNITDIDDKIIQKTMDHNTTVSQLVNEFTNAFHNICERMNILPPDHEPRATEFIPQMIAAIEKLLISDKAYITKTGVYFDISKGLYGCFKHIHDGMSRVEHDEDKRTPRDFALWKFTDLAAYDSPWGMGRPGWNIECTVMFNELIGPNITIHGGGCDLQFPHHENELAQLRGLYNNSNVGPHIWMHNHMINIDGLKMSKSLGNAKYMKDIIIDKFHSDLWRLIYLNHSYNKEIFITDQLINHHREMLLSLRRLCINETFHQAVPMEQMLEFLCDDLNTPKVIQGLFSKTAAEIYVYMQFLGFYMEPNNKLSIPEINTFFQAYLVHKQAKNFTESDAIRKVLIEDLIGINDDKWFYL